MTRRLTIAGFLAAILGCLLATASGAEGGNREGTPTGFRQPLADVIPNLFVWTDTCNLHGTIDGRKVAFTGDNIFGDPTDPKQTGHEAVVAHNIASLEEGYIYAAEYLKRLDPDILVGGHSFVMDRPAAFIERYRLWAYDMREAFRACSARNRTTATGSIRSGCGLSRIAWCCGPGRRASVSLHLRNFLPGPQQHRIELHVPPGIAVEPATIDGQLEGCSRASFPRAVDGVG